VVDAHKRELADDVTRPCALGSRRVEDSSKTYSSPSARDFYAYMDMPPLTATHTALAVRVTERDRREPRGRQ